MAPVRSHIRITNNHVLSIRTFLNREKLYQNQAPVIPNEKPTKTNISFQKCRKLIISNRHLCELYNDPVIKEKLISILFQLKREEIFSISSAESSNDKTKSSFKDNDTLYIPFSSDNWKCSIMINWNEIEILRNWICGEDTQLGRINWNKCEELLLKSVKFEIRSNIDDFSDDETNVETKVTDFSYSKTWLAPIDINIQVCSKV